MQDTPHDDRLCVLAVLERRKNNTKKDEKVGYFEKVDAGGGNRKSPFDNACLRMKIAGAAKDMLKYLVKNPNEQCHVDFFLGHRECFGTIPYPDNAIRNAFEVLALRVKSEYTARFTIQYDPELHLLSVIMLRKEVEHNPRPKPTKAQLAAHTAHAVARQLGVEFKGKIKRALTHAEAGALPHEDIDGGDFLRDPL
jgi:hypothetical protein